MKKEFSSLFEKNIKWSADMVEKDPDFFRRLAAGQQPEYLWIGCSDSRVPPERIMGAAPGEVFVHRNIANLVHHNDLNVLSILQYSVEVLKVRHILVCGHYACGGVKAALDTADHGLIDNWIRPIKQIYEDHITEFDTLSEKETVDRLCEWNVRRQVINVAQTAVLQKAWRQNREIAVHGLIYNLEDGKLIDLEYSLDQAGKTPSIFHIQ